MLVGVIMDRLDLRVIDHWDDQGLLLRKKLGANVPAIFKTAADTSEATSRHPSDYGVFVKTASGVVAKFPVVDPGNAAASAIYFSEVGRFLPEELQKEAAARINTALESFGLPVEETLTKTAAMELGYSTEADNLALETLFDIENDDQFEIIQDEFADASPRGKRRLAFQVKTAGLNLDDIPDLKDYAGTQVGPNLGLSIEARKMAIGWEPEGAAVLDVIMEKTASGAISPDDAVTALEVFDKKTGVAQYYGRSVPDPVYSIYGGGEMEGYEKTASSTVSLGGRDYEASEVVDFAKGAASRLEDQFGTQFTQQFAADPVGVLESLPDPHKAAIAGMMDEGA